jgi:hypothetical protein
MVGGGPDPRQGDMALAAVVRLHSLAMSGGLLDAVEGRPASEIADSLAGFRYFGLDDAAAAVEWVVAQALGTDLDDIEAAEALGGEADERYGAVVPDDSALIEAFQRVYQARPEAFSALM